jgi:hypothetical protein
MLLIFLASCGIGYFYLNTRADQRNDSKVDEGVTVIKNDVENETISTETTEEKISPNAELTEVVLYKKCGHEIAKSNKVPRDIVNLDEKEFEEKYKEYKIEEFSDKQVSIYNEVDKMCPEHYKIGVAEGVINIYRKDEDGEEELYEMTNISLEYLPEEEKIKLENGIEIIGEEELNSVLENLES